MPGGDERGRVDRVEQRAGDPADVAVGAPAEPGELVGVVGAGISPSQRVNVPAEPAFIPVPASAWRAVWLRRLPPGVAVIW